MGNTESKFAASYAFTDEIPPESGDAGGAVVVKSATDKATMKASYSVLEYDDAKLRKWLDEQGVLQQLGNINELVTLTVKRMKTLRHPFLLKYHDFKFLQPNVACVIVEPVRWLKQTVGKMCADEILLGLYHVGFLHEKGGLAHRNIGLGSIFLTVAKTRHQARTWKLGRLELSQDLSSISEEERRYAIQADWDTFMELIRELVTPLLEQMDHKAKKQVIEILRVPKVSNYDKIRVMFEDIPVVRVSDFVRWIRTLDPEWKSAAATKCAESVELIHYKALCNCVVPMLMTQDMLTESDANVLMETVLYRFMNWVNDESLDEQLVSDARFTLEVKIIPFIMELLLSKKYEVRLRLMELWKPISTLICNMLQLKPIQDTIVPQLLNGVRDKDERIHSSSLIALLQLFSALVPRASAIMKDFAEVVEGLLFPVLYEELVSRPPAVYEVKEELYVAIVVFWRAVAVSFEFIELTNKVSEFLFKISHLLSREDTLLLLKKLGDVSHSRYGAGQMVKLLGPFLCHRDPEVQSEASVNIQAVLAQVQQISETPKFNLDDFEEKMKSKHQERASIFSEKLPLPRSSASGALSPVSQVNSPLSMSGGSTDPPPVVNNWDFDDDDWN